ncbi:hypothetical protein P261_00444 [Lachnospiraceae bacterium TWA4]|nr:hypothetical protein P261_00444 [Lachnospiraceae bacterium TWA4]
MGNLKTESKKPRFVAVYYDLLESDLLDMSEKMIFIMLKKFADEESKCFPSVNTLAKSLGASKPTVIKKLKSLEEKGIIEVIRRKSSDGKDTSNLYILHEDIPSAANEENKKSPEPTPTKVQNQDSNMYQKEKPSKNDDTEQPKECQEDSKKSDSTDSNKSNELPKNKPSQEVYSLDSLKSLYNCSSEKADSVIEIIYDVVNSNKKTIVISGNTKSIEQVRERLLSLTNLDIVYVIDKFNGQADIKNVRAYILTLLYNARSQRVLESGRTKAVVNPYRTKFHNFVERNNDYDALVEEFSSYL